MRLAYAALSLVVLVPLAVDEATATAAEMSCASLSRAGAGGTRFWQAELSTPDQQCNASSDPVVDVSAGGTFTIHCTEWTDGLAPAEPADSVFIYLYHDADSYQSVGSAFGLRRLISLGASCTDSPTVSAACTHDGTPGSIPRYGLLRIILRADRNGVPGYDIESDAAGGTSGVVRCNPTLTQHSAAHLLGPVITKLVPGDTTRTATAAGALPYAGEGGTAKVSHVCGAQDNLVTSSFLLGTALSTHDKQITTPTSAWPDDCTIQSKLTLTRKSSLPGLSALDYAKLVGTPPAGTTFDGAGLVATRSAAPYDATHTVSLPTWASPRCSGPTSETFRIAVDLMAFQPTEVRNARGELVTYAKTFVANVTEYETGISIGQKEFNGVTDPTAPCATLAPTAPPSDHWRYNVTVTDAHGGLVKAFKNVTFTAPGGGSVHVNTSVNVDFNDDYDVGLLDDRLDGPAPYVGRIVTRGGSLVAQVSIDVDADGAYDAQYTGRSAIHTHTWSEPGLYPWVVKVLYTDGTAGYAYGETHVRSAYAKDPLTQPGGGLFAPNDERGGFHFTPALMWDWIVGLALLSLASLILYFRIIAGNG